MQEKNFRPILIVDFDGVLHSYSSGWKGIDVIPDPPVPGAQEFTKNALAHFRIAVFSSRSEKPEGIQAMQTWMEQHQFPVSELEFPITKPPAFLTLDDRGWQFNGSFPDVQELLDFIPWWKDEEKK